MNAKVVRIWTLSSRVLLVAGFLWIWSGEVLPVEAQRESAAQGGGALLTMEEYNFLLKLGQNVNNRAVTHGLYTIIEKLKTTPRLLQGHYDFLVDLSGKINDPKVSEGLLLIGKAHHPTNPIAAAPQTFRTPEGYAPQQAAPQAQSAPVSTGAQTLTMDEYNFLLKLGQSISNRAITKRIYEIIEALKTSPRLSQGDHDFLLDLAAKVNSPQVVRSLSAIAKTRKPL